MTGVKKIAELLPENLTEDTLNKVATLVNDTIQNEVKTRISLLESQVKAFLRSHIDEVKQQALKELEAENETYKNARKFEAIKTLMALELGPKDGDKALTEAVTLNSNLQEENGVLVEELTKSLNYIKKLETYARASQTKLKKLQESNSRLNQNVRSLQESSMHLTEDHVNSSERAVLITRADTRLNEQQVNKVFENSLITEDMLDLLPENTKKKIKE